MGDDIWEYYAKDMMFESHKEPHYITQQYIKHLERERDKWRKLADLARQAWQTDSWVEFNDAYLEAVGDE